MANEVSGLAELAADAIDRYGVTPAELMHRGISRRVFDRIGVMSAPVRFVHDRAAQSSYAVTRRAVTGAGTLVAAGVRGATADAEMRPLSNSRAGRFVVAAVNAMAGDRLAERRNDLTIAMSLRQGGRDIPCTQAALRALAPRATPHLAVFLHGLAENEEWWVRRDGGAGSRRRSSLGAMLQRESGFTPVYIRYNTGLHISENGRQLATLLEAIVREWPVPVERMVLIGHSMGGLVVRSACHHGTDAAHVWPQHVAHVVTLGTPHHGAPLAKAVHALAWMLRPLPEGAAFAHVLQTSAGIGDLSFGALHEDDWREATSPFEDRRRTIPLLPHSRYTFITATLTLSPRHPLALALGDLLVRTESASGRCRERTIAVPPESVVHLGGLTHFDLLDHPLVHDALRAAVLRGVDDRATRPVTPGRR